MVYFDVKYYIVHIYVTIFSWNTSAEGEVGSATTIWLPSDNPRSARDSFKFFLVASSMLAGVFMYRVLFLPPMVVVAPGDFI